MIYRKLGANGPEVSVVAFGAWQIGDPAYWGPDDQADHDAAVHAAVDAGITLFDTAEMYGNGESEVALGRALGERRRSVLIASKVRSDHCDPEALVLSCEASLRRLNTDYIDLYQVHWPSREVPFEVTYEVLAILRSAGKIRAIGVSNFGPIDLDAWMACGDGVSNQIGYSLAFRTPEHTMLPACARHGLGVLVYMPLLQGILTGRWPDVESIPASRRRTRHFAATRPGTRHGEPGCESQLMAALAGLRNLAAECGRPVAHLALAWLLAKPPVTSVVLGARNPAQLARNAEVADWAMPPEVVARIDALTQPMKDALGTNVDMWESTENCRIR